MSVLRKFAAVFAVVVFTAACTTPDYKRFPDISFGHLPPINMAVGETSVASSFKSSFNLPRVENEMPVLPERVIRGWVSDRIVATGEGTGTLTLTVTDASVTASALETDKNIKAWFTDEQAVRYQVNLAATVEVDDPAVSAQGIAKASAQRSITVPEGATLNDREQALFDMISAASADLDQALETNIRRHLSRWIR